LGHRVRQLRLGRGLTLEALAASSGLSLRFLGRIERGDGNVSLVRLAALARALDVTLADLVRDAERRDVIALVGLRGAGKSTVGPLLASRLVLPFVEMDQMIGEASGLALDQIFELHGEPYYRHLEREAVGRVLARAEPMVLAAAGGVVNDPETWELLCRGTTVVWLRASPEEHWHRVVAQGDRRPMADNPRAMEQLRALLESRAPLYAAAALAVETSGRAPADIVDEIARGLRAGTVSGGAPGQDDGGLGRSGG
jgi:XRE family aerobic/anaerobic benzoate catabolism transcriptional regulator